jgi:hypothetical protein
MEVHRNQYIILWRILEFVRQKMTLLTTSNSCLKYSNANSSIYVGTGIGYFKQLKNVYPKTSSGNIRPIAASDSLVAQTRR